MIAEVSLHPNLSGEAEAPSAYVLNVPEFGRCIVLDCLGVKIYLPGFDDYCAGAARQIAAALTKAADECQALPEATAEEVAHG